MLPGQASESRIAGLSGKTWLNVMLVTEGVLILLLVVWLLGHTGGKAPGSHELGGAQGGAVGEQPLPAEGSVGEAGKLAGKWPQPAKGVSPPSVPEDEVTHVPTVTRGNEGVVVRKDRETGTEELIIDPFPEEGSAKKQKPKTKRPRDESVDTGKPRR